MTTSSLITIAFFAVAAVLILIALVWAFLGRRSQRPRQAEAHEHRESAKEELLAARQSEALANETAARAGAAQAEADIKAAQAAGLQRQAAAHRSEAATSRHRLNERWDRADQIDPPTPEAVMPHRNRN